MPPVRTIEDSDVRELSLSQILDGAFRMVRRNVKTVSAIVLFFLGPYVILAVLVILAAGGVFRPRGWDEDRIAWVMGLLHVGGFLLETVAGTVLAPVFWADVLA